MCVREGSDQPVHPCSVIRIFTDHIRKLHDPTLCYERPAKTDQPAQMKEISRFDSDTGHSISYIFIWALKEESDHPANPF